jgi:hypothetical protein
MEKAAVIDKRGVNALHALYAFIGDNPDEILAVAKGRHILGHYEYGDSNLFEWSDGKVRAAIIEELADALVYQAWLEERASQ